jgi:hypothetical protein
MGQATVKPLERYQDIVVLPMTTAAAPLLGAIRSRLELNRLIPIPAAKVIPAVVSLELDAFVGRLAAGSVTVPVNVGDANGARDVSDGCTWSERAQVVPAPTAATPFIMGTVLDANGIAAALRMTLFVPLFT